MAFFNLSFVFGLWILLYLASFVFFALLRITTGISIQRVGYLSLRRIAYTPRDGVKIEIRSLGLLLHRPTFARPTWLSLQLEELQVIVDLKAVGGPDAGSPSHENSANGAASHSSLPRLPKAQDASSRSQTWARLTQIKDRLKRAHRRIHWLRVLDLVATDSTITILEVGHVQIGSFTAAVDVRSKIIQRTRLFHHEPSPSHNQCPVEWMFTMRSAFLKPDGKESVEIIDLCSLNVHGILYQDLNGLRDARVALKFGRVYIPYDDLRMCAKQAQYSRSIRTDDDDFPKKFHSKSEDVKLLDAADARADHIMQTVSDSKEFVTSILRGIKEVQFAVSHVRMSKEIHNVQLTGTPLYLNASMKEVAMDLHRLNPRSPAHRMYFSPSDISHEALLAAIGLHIDLDDGHQIPERLAHIPMTTATIKTTLPSKTFQAPEEKSLEDRNANILFANVVVTSPSLDLDPKHLPLVLALAQSRRTRVSQSAPHKNHLLISRLLPKALVKLSIHEPVLRVTLPATEHADRDSDDYDLLISSNSAISFDLESSHSAVGELHYSLACNLRIVSHQFYYQTARGSRHNMLMTDTLELKIQMSANPSICVSASGSVQTFSVHMVRPEISEGVRQIVQHLTKDIPGDKADLSAHSPEGNVLRKMPSWLNGFDIRGSNFSLEVTGVDQEISPKTRGLALQLESWTAEYTHHKAKGAHGQPPRQRQASRLLRPEDALPNTGRPSPAHRKSQGPTDERRLTVHLHELDGFVVDAVNAWEPRPCLSLPRWEVALSTSSDAQGPILHVHSFVKTLFIEYSLYRYYAIGVAMTLLKDIFKGIANRRMNHPTNDLSLLPGGTSGTVSEFSSEEHGARVLREYTTIDVKASLIQVKASFPSDPDMMLQIYSLEAGNHRWTPRFLKAMLVRVFVQAPKIPGVWARITCIKSLRVDFRETKKKQNSHFVEERSIDIAADAIRIAVPHQLRPHCVTANLTNTVKATKQLQHRFNTGTDEYILGQEPEGPKKVPRITIRTRALLLELEDGPFEWRLSMIYRVGLVEQRQRLARDEAFDAKVRKLSEGDSVRASVRFDGRTLNSQSIGKSASGEEASLDDEGHLGTSSSTEGSGYLRHARHGKRELSESAHVSVRQAWTKMHHLNAQSWKKRIDWAFDFQQGRIKEIRGMFWEADELPDGTRETERVLEYPNRPALMAAMISDFRLRIDKPSFPLAEYPEFLHRIGKGMPYNMTYSLLVPMNVHMEMGESRITLRDYPLPLLHIPPIRPNQSPRTPSWSVKTDFVIAEESRDQESTRHVKVVVVPPEKAISEVHHGGFAIDVKRTASPVKTYSDVKIEVKTGYATKMTWANSYQPALQDMMQVIETFTKPQVDPSERPGFWDKIRLVFHSRLDIEWTGDGDVHLMLKGSRDPYVVTGYGAGFMMCWRNEVRWQICQDEDPRRFMTVNSGEYILAVPDYTHQARQTIHTAENVDTASTTSVNKSGVLFKKVIMKLTGNVQWQAGLVFERNVEGGGRSFDFAPHYDVVIKTPAFAKAKAGETYDAFRGFRSNHIHLSIAVIAPLDRDWSASNLKASTNYNSVHLTPRFFTHFFDWLSLFSGVMSLPVRQGSLWPGLEKTKAKKFGRHLATIKYKLLLSPLFIGHIYKHKDAEDYRENLVSATGLKIKLDSFMIDLHQRREENLSKDRKASVKTSHMRINQAQVDFISADIRAVSASIAGTTLQDLKKASEETLASYQQPIPAVDLSRFTIPDNDFSWIDMDDFVELDWILPTETNPKTQIMPLAFAPRFTYFRQTDHHDVKSGDPVQSSRLGDELTHFCVMSPDNDPRRIQRDLIQERLEMLNRQMAHFQRALGEAELKVIRDANGDTSFKAQFEMLKHHGSMLDTQKQYLQALMENMSGPPDGNDYLAIPAINRRSRTRAHTQPHIDTHSEDLETAPLSEYANDFDNRFIVHNPQIKWHNTLRNIILRYIHQVNQRRGFVYYLSRRAVKFLLDIIMEQNKAQRGLEDSFSQSPAASRLPSIGTEDEDMTVEDRIQQLLRDAKKFVDADDPQESEGSPGRTKESAGEQLSRDYTSQNSYHIRLIAPQIQLQSEQNTSAAVLVAAKGMQLRIVQIMDRNRVADDVSGLVQRRFSADMNNVQIFVTNQKDFASQFLPMFSGKRYGAAGDGTWPPWLPLEVMFDYSIDPFGFSRVVQRTSASLRYDKYNTLRLKINEDVSRDSAGHSRTPHTQENHIDRIWVEFPRIRAICDSSQYYAIFVIVTDLLMFTEPLEKVRTDRLERIMLASDFSDLRGAPEMVTQLQQRIRQLEEIKMRFQLNARFLDRQGWEDRLTVEQDLAGCEDELFFMMKAITTSQRKLEDRSASNALLRWYLSGSEVVWRLTREGKEPLAEFQLENAVYDRIDNTDGSNHNSMHVDMILGFNLLSTATYPEMIAPYYDHAKQVGDGRDVKMLRVHWQKLEAIAGINVMDHFEVNLFPLKIQLEREVGKQIFEYIFPGSGSAMGPSSKPSSTVPSPRTPGPPLEKLIEHPALAENPPNDIPREEQEPSSQGRTLLMRLKPTLASSDHSQQSTPLARRPRMHSDRATQNGDLRSFHLFQTGRRSQSILKTSPVATPKSKRSMESLRMTALKPLERPSTSPTYRRSSMVPENSTRFSLRRGSTKEGEEEKDKGGSDELSQMMLRASNYMTLAYVKVPSVVLCLSYQGKGERNLEDLHNFVFRMPILEYRNKTWSNLELALRLKRDIIKALISHTGAIIGNKFAHHRPHKQHSGRVRELSSLSPAVVHVDGGGSSNDGATTASESSSRRGSSGGHTGLGADQSGSPAGRSLASLSEQGAGSNKAHSIPPTSSYASSMYSPGLGINAGNGGTTPSEKGSVFNSEGHFTSTAAVPIVTGDHADAAAAVAAAAAAPEGHHSFAHPKHILGKHLSHLGHLTIGRHAKDRVGGGGPSPGPSPGTRSGGAGPVPSPGVTTTITADEPEEHINSTSQPRRKGRHLLGKRILPSLGG